MTKLQMSGETAEAVPGPARLCFHRAKAPVLMRVGSWSLEFVWCLEVGAWCFFDVQCSDRVTESTREVAMAHSRGAGGQRGHGCSGATRLAARARAGIQGGEVGVGDSGLRNARNALVV